MWTRWIRPLPLVPVLLYDLHPAPEALPKLTEISLILKVRGGLTFREGHYICEAIHETGLLVALDIMVRAQRLHSRTYSFAHLRARARL